MFAFESMPNAIVTVSTVALCFCSTASTAQQGVPAPFDVVMRVDVSRPGGELKPIYRFFGADEPNYATMKDGRKLLGELGKLGRPQTYFRAHSLLVTGDGTPALKWGSTNIYTEDSQGRPIYDWTIVDHIFETYLARGLKPYAQIGFMPKALSTHPEPYQHEWRPGLPYDDVYTGWAYPPKDYAKWGELVYQWVKHCVERFGRAEVEQWYWEVWNEPNIVTGVARPKSFRSCTTTRSPACVVRYPRRVWAAPTSPVVVASSCRTFSSTFFAAGTTHPARREHR
jgi:xylan 1,4-beta-xylosidase